MQKKMGYEKRIEAIRLWEEEHLTTNAIAKRFAVTPTVIQDLVDRFRWNGLEFLKEKRTEYSESFKNKIIEEIQEKTLSITQICAKNNLPRSTVGRWYKQIVLGESVSKKKDKNIINSKPPVSEERIEEIRKKYKNIDNKEMRELLEQNYYLQMENDILKKLATLTLQEQEEKQK